MASKKTGTNQTKKQTVSGKQAQMVRELRGGNLFLTLLPWLLGALALLFFFCLLFPTAGGGLGPVLRDFLLGLFSAGAYVLPILLLNVALFWRRDRENGVVVYKAVFSLLFLLFFAAFVSVFAPQEVTGTFAPATLFESGKTMVGGGLLGSLLANALIALVGKVVTGILSMLVMLFSVCFLLGKTPAELWGALAARVRERREAARIWQEEGEGQEGDLYPVGEEAEPAPAPKKARRGRIAAALFEDEDEEEPVEDHGPDEEELHIPLNDDDIDPAGEDITKFNPRRAEKASLTDAVQDVFGKQEDPALARRFSDGQDTEDASSDAAELDLVTDKDPPSAPKKARVYRFPPLSLLSDRKVKKQSSERESRETAEKLIRTLETFHVNATLCGISQGPTVTRYELQPEAGVRVKTIAGLSEDIAMRLAAKDIRIEAPIPGREAVGIEIPNKTVCTVCIRELLEKDTFRHSDNPLLCCLGMDVAGEAVFCDLSKMPHLLIAGATGMGKSVCINSFLISLLYKATPEEVQLILVDPKNVEMNVYNGISHLLVPVVSDPKKAAGALNWAVNEMERRFSVIGDLGVRSIKAYNEIARQNGEDPLPRIVIVIDELADLMMSARDHVETAICRLAQKARAAGIHLIIGTQRPSVDVITGLIKANFPSRIAFTVASQIDSRTILDLAGAERLIGNGDMLFAPVGSIKPTRVQGSFVSDREVEAVVDFLKREKPAEYNEKTIADIEKEASLCVDKKRAAAGGGGDLPQGDPFSDPVESGLLLRAIEIALDNGGVATSLLQRRLSIGYARAARLIDTLEERGIVGPHNGARPREILITREEFLEMKTSAGAGPLG